MSSPSQAKLKIALLVPDGIGVRNYLFSSLLQHFGEHQILLLHQLPNEVIQEVEQLHPKKFEAYSIPSIKESKTNDLVRKWCMFARLHRNSSITGNESIKKNWLFFALQKGKRKIFYRLLDKAAALLAASPVIMDKTESWLFKRMQKSQAGHASTAFLKQLMPDIILCTHQRSVEAGYLMTAANQLKIYTCAVIFSWDNLPKSRINFSANTYFVWSQYMKQEMHTYYPKIADEQVIITGTPQFDAYYSNQGLWSEDAFRNHFEIPASRPTICFSGNEPSFPSDHMYLQDVLEELNAWNAEVKPIVLVRPSPNDATGRLEHVASQFPALAIVAAPRWKRIGNRDWESNYPTLEDAEVLMNLVYHCACVINFGSTMGVDFAHFDKPALYINYNHPDCNWLDLIYGYKQQHFKTLDGLHAVEFISNRNAFVPSIMKAIEMPGTIAPDRLLWKRKITDDIKDASSAIAQKLIMLAQYNLNADE